MHLHERLSPQQSQPKALDLVVHILEAVVHLVLRDAKLLALMGWVSVAHGGRWRECLCAKFSSISRSVRGD